MTLLAPIVSVNTGAIALLGKSPGGRDVYSGIRKAPVVGGTPIMLRGLGLDGDQQTTHRDADGRRIHGGVDKAVYIYPHAHYAAWMEERGTILTPGDFGENLTVGNLTEDEVFIGDRWRWGQAVLEVTGPRRPCAKLNMLRGEGTAQAMMRNGRCGWYCKVIRPARVPTANTSLRLISRRGGAYSIAWMFRTKTRRDPTVPTLREDMPKTTT